MAKWGNSQGVRIPQDILASAHMSGNETVEITANDGLIIIKKAAKRKTIEELFAASGEDYESEKIDWGPPVGEEIW
jgi:antitoxin MazE